MGISAYTLVTPAKNEGGYIERTIQCVLSQTVRPLKWVIVDDGSTDQTAAIAEAYASRHSWITVVRRIAGTSRDFASKARSFATGYERLEGLAHGYVGNLDSDVSFAPDYYERLLTFFEADTGLGIAGGSFHEVAANGKRYPVTTSPDSVRGAVQMFRRRCYEDVGGYLSLPMGGIDSAAEIVARMKGWKVRQFRDLAVLHLRPTGSGMGAFLRVSVRRGFQDRSLGYQGLFEATRCSARMRERPYVIGGLSVLFGYCWSWLRGDLPVLSDEIVRFLRREQRSKLVQQFERIVSFR